MKTEKIIISFIAVVIGLLFAGVAFYLYQSTKIVKPSNTKTVTIIPPTPTFAPTVFLSVENPKDGDVVNKKTININGKTIPDATILVSTETSDEVVAPARNGAFSVTATIEDGTNQLTITAIAPNGEEAKVIRTITFSTENF